MLPSFSGNPAISIVPSPGYSSYLNRFSSKANAGALGMKPDKRADFLSERY
jgi:hypothetical protein